MLTHPLVKSTHTLYEYKLTKCKYRLKLTISTHWPRTYYEEVNFSNFLYVHIAKKLHNVALHT